MENLITVFRMEEVSKHTRIKLIKELGKQINNEHGANLTEGIVYELVLLLNPNDPIKDDKHFLGFVSN